MKILVFSVLFASLASCNRSGPSHMVNPEGLNLESKSSKPAEKMNSEQNPQALPSGGSDSGQVAKPDTMGKVATTAAHLFMPDPSAVPLFRCLNRKSAFESPTVDQAASLQLEAFKALAAQGKATQCVDQFVSPAPADALLNTFIDTARVTCAGDQEFTERASCEPPTTGLQFMSGIEQNMVVTNFSVAIRMTYAFINLTPEELNAVKTGLKAVQLPSGGPQNTKFDLTPDLK